jgi:diphthamide biosynthesis protein 3
MADEDVNLYDEIEIEDCFYDATLQIYHHPCPCGDRFEISLYDMRDGEDIARCPSCSLMIRVIFDQVSTSCLWDGRRWKDVEEERKAGDERDSEGVRCEDG